MPNFISRLWKKRDRDSVLKFEESLRGEDSEDIFLSNLTADLSFWNTRIKYLERFDLDAKKEKEYAAAYRLLIHQFTSEITE